MNDVESGVSFFVSGAEEFSKVPTTTRPFVLKVCAREMILCRSTDVEPFRCSPALAREIQDPDLLRSIYDVAAEISRRSAKHSADFLNATSTVAGRLLKYSEASFSGGLSPAEAEPLNEALIEAAKELAKAFATRAGGIAADAWAAVPYAIGARGAAQGFELMARTAR